MLKKRIKYTDYDGQSREEDFYFNLSKAELMEMEMGTSGGMTKMINKIVEEQDTAKIMSMFKDIIMKSYGEKSLDGKRFVKSKELSEAFTQTEAYSELLMELITKENAAADFIKKVIPEVPENNNAIPSNQ